MKNRQILPFINLMCVLALMSCKNSSTIAKTTSLPHSSNQSLVDATWVLTWMKSTSIDTINFAKGLPTLALNTLDSTAQGSTGCNQMNAKLAVSSVGDFTFTWLNTTKMYCLDSVEPQYLENLTRINRYKIENEILILLENETPLLNYKKLMNEE